MIFTLFLFVLFLFFSFFFLILSVARRNFTNFYAVVKLLYICVESYNWE